MSSDRRLRPTPTDGYPTPTSNLQSSTENVLKAHLPSAASAQFNVAGQTSASERAPTLHKQQHIQFLLRNLLQGFPERYVSQDASQPWLIFWTLQAFSALGVGMDDQTKKRARQTLLAMQAPSGGFSGGPGQAAHLLPTYAAVCALAIVGQPGEGGGWDQVDRKKHYEFFMSLKQPDGSFTVSRDAEVDVRGLYCLMAVATMLNIVTPELVRGMPEFIVSCQSYEGGFGNASFPEWSFPEAEGASFDPSAPRPVIGEAHGGYTFCATATWVLLQPYIRQYYTPSSPCKLPKPQINLRALLRWLVQMQGSEIELGGFRGRTNKLVDGCYSWWVGGCFGLVEALLGPGHVLDAVQQPEEEWHEVDDSLLNRDALQEYILYAGQHPAGGLRDKPPKSADSYHTLYCLSGLSAAQHRVIPDEARREELRASWDEKSAKEYEGSGYIFVEEECSLVDAVRKETFVSTLSWMEEEGASRYVGGAANRVNATHPLFNLTITHTQLMMAHFYGQTLPQKLPKKSAEQ